MPEDLEVEKWLAQHNKNARTTLTVDSSGIVEEEEYEFYKDDYSRVSPWFDGYLEDLEGSLEEEFSTDTKPEINVEVGEHGLIDVLPSNWTEFAVKVPDDRGVPQNFSFDQRPYLRAPYDIQCYRLLLMCGRQVEKCLPLDETIHKSNGDLIEIKDVRKGDEVLSYCSIRHETLPKTVTYVSQKVVKECVEIRTALGHRLRMSIDHPVRQWDRWTQAGLLTRGDLVLTAKKVNLPQDNDQYSDEDVWLTALFIARRTNRYHAITMTEKEREEIVPTLERLGIRLNRWIVPRKQGGPGNQCIQIDSWEAVRERLFEGDDQYNAPLFYERSIPAYIFSLPERQKRLFLFWMFKYSNQRRRIEWRGGDAGYQYRIAFSHLSYKLTRQLQALLWSFGILTRYSTPKENFKNKTYRYWITVTSEDGIKKSLEDLGLHVLLDQDPEDRYQPFDLSHTDSLYRVDKRIESDFKRIYLSRVGDIPDSQTPPQFGCSLFVPSNTPYNKVKGVFDYLKDRPHYFDLRSVDDLEKRARGEELFWDHIVEIKNIGFETCVDISVEDTGAFLSNGIITHNSTLIGNSILARMAITPHFRALYVSPTHEQTKTFRRDRIGDPISLSEVYQKFISSTKTNNMSMVKFINYAQLVLRYAYLTADRVRGIPADVIYIDEIQDILTGNIPVIEECAGHANPLLKMFVYSGTPKSFDNTINHLWVNRSTQNEWAIPSEARQIFDLKKGDAKDRSHKYYWNVPLDEGNVGLKGLICKTYGTPIYPLHPDAQWVSMNPSIREHPRLEPFESFRIPQLMVPWIRWGDILDKMESYPRGRLFNEVFALPFDSGTRPLKQQDLMECSRKDLSMRVALDAMARAVQSKPVFFGIDWGSGENSYTVLTMGTYLGGTTVNDAFTNFYFKRFTGVETDPEVQLEVIHKLIALFRPLLIGVDYGGGFDRNKNLINRYGPQRIIRYQYIGGLGSTAKRPKIVYDGAKGRYMLERTEIMSDYFNAIKDAKIEFPMWEDWAEPYGQDFLAIFSEYNEVTRTTRYDVHPEKTDDSFHSALLCFFVSQVIYPRPDIVRPSFEK